MFISCTCKCCQLHTYDNLFLLQDFDMNSDLKIGVMCLLEEVLRDPDLLPQERKATTNILR